jgi:uncharacterized Zn-finger protein
MAHDEFFLLNDREIVVTDHLEVRCDGNGLLGHPAVYMTLEKAGEAVCKYCGRRYLHTSHPDVPIVRRDGLPVVPSAA